MYLTYPTSRTSTDSKINSPLDLAKKFLATVKKERKLLKSLEGCDSFQSLELRHHLYLMSMTYPQRVFSTDTRTRAFQVLKIANTTAHVDGKGWTEPFFEESVRKLGDFIETLQPSDSREAEIFEELDKCKKTGNIFHSFFALPQAITFFIISVANI